jgi:hypothetical protein
MIGTSKLDIMRAREKAVDVGARLPSSASASARITGRRRCEID